MNAIDLRVFLSDAAQAGAYFVDLHDRAAIVVTGTMLEYVVVSIDLRDCRDQADALLRFAQELHFPDWFGGNWDALADTLGDLSWLPAAGYLLLLDHAQDWRAAAPDEFGMLLEILDEAAGRWAADGVAFWALLPLPTALLAVQEDRAAGA